MSLFKDTYSYVIVQSIMLVLIKKLVYLILFVGCCLLVMSLNVSGSGGEDWGSFVYEEGEWETMIVDLVTRQVSTLPISAFADDPQLVQRVDRGNKLSLYFEMVMDAFGGNENGTGREVYRRKRVDAKVPIVVLSSHQDHLPIHSRKRTFVVLRQNPETNTTYFVSYVYLRFWTDKQEHCKETYLNEKLCMEWDTWDNDRGEVKVGHKFFGWTDCASSFLYSCSSNVMQQKDSINGSGLNLVERGYRNQTLTFGDNNVKVVKYRPAPGIPMDDTIDAFWDLETGPGEGRYVRETIRYSSVFRRPLQFNGFTSKGGTSGISGRALLAAGENGPKDSLSTLKKKVAEQSLKDRKNRELLHIKLKDRTEWFRTKAGLNNLIRKYVKELGYAGVDVIKGMSDNSMESFKGYQNVSKVLQALEEMGDGYKLNNEVVVNETRRKAKPEVSLLLGAESKRTDIDTPSTKAFGQALGSIMAQSGGGMSGRALGEVDNKVAATIAKSILFSSTDTFQIPGWKLQEVVEFRPNITLALESHIFYGLGSCPHKTLTNKDLKLGVASQFLTLFRTYCLPEARQYLDHLVVEKYVEIKQDNGYFSIPKQSALLQSRKLRTDEVRQMTAALELAAFSQTYVNVTQMNKANPWVPLSSVSRSVHFLQNFGLKFVTMARVLGDEHFVKLCRNLVITLKGVMTKLMQDEEILLGECKDKETCRMELDLNDRDRFGVHALMQFLIRGLAPVEKSLDSKLEIVFQQFVKNNNEALQQSLAFYN